MASSDVKLGELISGAAQRDAIHIAVAPVWSAARLSPGQHVGFVTEGDTQRVGLCENPIGIVDPFLKGPIEPQARFWLLLFPQTVTGLRHEWTHPAFELQSESQEYIADVAATCGISYEELVSAATRHAETGDYEYCGGDPENERYKRGGIDWEAFWRHWSIVTGKPVPADAWAPFTCSC